MALDTATHKEVHDHHGDEDLWSGGKQPFKASYGKLMMWYFLLSDAFTFAGFLIAYGALRFSVPTWPVPDFVFSTFPGGFHHKPLFFVTFMTFVLLASSYTMVRAVQEGQRENKNGVIKWMFYTIIGGLMFLGCQAWEWTTLIGTEGMSVLTNPFSNHEQAGHYASADELKKAGFKETTADVHGAKATYFLKPGDLDIEENRYFEKTSHFADDETVGKKINVDDPYLVTYSHDTHLYEFAAIADDSGNVIGKETFGPKAFGALFFFITGFHGFHVLSGVVFLIVILINVASGLYVERRNGYEMVEKIGLYWHFVDLVWVFVFLVFYLL